MLLPPPHLCGLLCLPPGANRRPCSPYVARASLPHRASAQFGFATQDSRICHSCSTSAAAWKASESQWNQTYAGLRHLSVQDSFHRNSGINLTLPPPVLPASSQWLPEVMRPLRPPVLPASRQWLRGVQPETPSNLARSDPRAYQGGLQMSGSSPSNVTLTCQLPLRRPSCAACSLGYRVASQCSTLFGSQTGSGSEQASQSRPLLPQSI